MPRCGMMQTYACGEKQIVHLRNALHAINHVYVRISFMSFLSSISLLCCHSLQSFFFFLLASSIYSFFPSFSPVSIFLVFVFPLPYFVLFYFSGYLTLYG